MSVMSQPDETASAIIETGAMRTAGAAVAAPIEKASAPWSAARAARVAEQSFIGLLFAEARGR